MRVGAKSETEQQDEKGKGRSDMKSIYAMPCDTRLRYPKIVPAWLNLSGDGGRNRGTTRRHGADEGRGNMPGLPSVPTMMP